MTVEEFDRFLGDFAEDAEQLVNELIPTVNDIVNEMKAADAAPVDKGNLQRSIQGVVRGDDVEFLMFDYGYYQNYGVSGQNDQLGVADIPAGVFGTPGPFKFKTRRYGLPAQDWYDFGSIAQRLRDAAEVAITNTNR